jgi:hypothetical protein
MNIKTGSGLCSIARYKGEKSLSLRPASARGHIIDLMEALKESMKTVERGKKRAEQKKRKA